MVGTLIAVLIGIRFYAELIAKYYPSHVTQWGKMDMLICLLMGIFFQPLMKLIWNKINKNKYFEKADVLKDIYFKCESTEDIVVSIDGEQYGVSCQELAQDQLGFYLKEDINNTCNLCTRVPQTIPTLTAVMSRHSNGVKYTLVSKDFVTV